MTTKNKNFRAILTLAILIMSISFFGSVFLSGCSGGGGGGGTTGGGGDDPTWTPTSTPTATGTVTPTVIPTSTPEVRGTIVGQVTESDGTPVSGASVEFVYSDVKVINGKTTVIEDRSHTATTDENGDYIIDNLTIGLNGYIIVTERGTFGSQNITVHENTNCDIIPSGMIQGELNDQTGQVALGVTVTTDIIGFSTQMSNRIGQFYLCGLPLDKPSGIVLTFTKPGYQTIAKTVIVQNPEPINLGILTMIRLDQTPTPNPTITIVPTATPTIGPTTTPTPGPTPTLPPTPNPSPSSSSSPTPIDNVTVEIYVTYTGTASGPADGVTVQFFDQYGNIISGMSGTTDANGYIKFENVPKAAYTISLDKTGCLGADYSRTISSNMIFNFTIKRL